MKGEEEGSGFKNMLAGRDESDEGFVAMVQRNASEDRAIFGNNLDKRLARLEQEGIVGEVLFPEPSVGNGYGDYGVPFAEFCAGAGIGDMDLLGAGYRAHNRWLAETADHSRQVALALITIHDVDAAVKEIHWAARAGIRGILLDGLHIDLPPLHDPIYDPMWSALEEENMPIHFHIGSGVGRTMGFMSNGDRVGLTDPISLHEMNFFAHRPLWFLILGGVCERHPNLRIVFTEMGAKWAAEAIQSLDMHYGVTINKRICPQLPSTYFERQVFFGFSTQTLEELKDRHDAGVPKLMWGSDHPHGGGGWGITHSIIRATFGAEKVSETETRAILGENLVNFYGLDMKKLKAIAERVGPTVDELLRDPDPSDFEDPVVRAKVEVGLSLG
jgi:predicted TIM-barrel fold metal-dependent hydrolase